ncbi:hypothetical protein CDL60_09535 [Roseateles noduli]|nr:hypothetical protein CDL60_09535 [Roseateles noduli]
MTMRESSSQIRAKFAQLRPAAEPDALQRRLASGPFDSSPRLLAQKRAIAQLGTAAPTQRAMEDAEDDAPQPAKRDTAQRFHDDSGERDAIAVGGHAVSQSIVLQGESNRSGINGPPVLQGRFDAQDIAKMRQVAADDDALSATLEELIAIQDNYPDDIGYGKSSKEGHAAINEQGAPQVVVKDERWQWSLKIKNLFNAYGMEHDVKRQSMIIHELTHIAEMMANHQPGPEGWAEDEKPKDEKQLAEWMTPPKELTDEIKWDELRESLTATDHDNELKKYIGQRLDYAYAFEWEAPTVLTELTYYLKAKGKSNDPFYAEVSRLSSLFHENRRDRRRQQ